MYRIKLQVNFTRRLRVLKENRLKKLSKEVEGKKEIIYAICEKTEERLAAVLAEKESQENLSKREPLSSVFSHMA